MKMYHIDIKSYLTQTVPKVRYLSNAKRTEKYTFFLRRKAAHSLCWNGNFPCFLWKNRNQEIIPAIRSFLSTQYTLPLLRFNPDHYLHLGGRDWAVNQQPNSKVQWFIPKISRHSIFSKSCCPSTFSQTSSYSSHSPNCSCSRPFTAKDIYSFREPTDKPDMGYRFNSANCLRTSSGFHGWVQSTKTWKTFISSITLYRISYPNILACILSTRKCLYKCWDCKIYEPMFGQSTQDYLPYKNPRQFWVFQRQLPQVYRGERHRLYYCCQIDSQNQGQDLCWISSFPERETWQGVRRVLSSTARLGKTSPIYCNASTLAGRRARTFATDPLETQKICISCFCNQPFPNTKKGVVFLLFKSKYRRRNQRVKKRFCLKQDTNGAFSCQSALFSFTGSCVQPGQLVYLSLFTKRLSFLDTANASFESVSLTREISKIWQQKRLKASRKLRISKPFRIRFIKDQKVKNYVICERNKFLSVGLN